MAYIGPAPNPGQNREVDDISSGFNGSEVNFTLQVGGSNVSPGSANAIIVSKSVVLYRIQLTIQLLQVLLHLLQLQLVD